MNYAMIVFSYIDIPENSEESTLKLRFISVFLVLKQVMKKFN